MHKQNTDWLKGWFGEESVSEKQQLLQIKKKAQADAGEIRWFHLTSKKFSRAESKGKHWQQHKHRQEYSALLGTAYILTAK